MRANSRPACVCNQEFSGSYCEVYDRIHNFTVQLDKELTLNNTISNEIEGSLISKLSDLFETNSENIQVNNVNIIYIRYFVFT